MVWGARFVPEFLLVRVWVGGKGLLFLFCMQEMQPNTHGGIAT